MTDDTDISFLLHAIRLGARGLGRTYPNPPVGCVMVKDGAVIATATTADSGRPHAETLALKAAGEKARGATVYVSLEPCSHHGQTPACADALIAAGVARVVIAAKDPNPNVNGAGMAALRAAGITVSLKQLTEADENHRGFFRRIQHGLPYAAMKLATSADHYMAYAAGSPQWLTGEEARRHAHSVRGRMDAILTGIGTVLADNPALTCRIKGAESPRLVRVVADRNLRLPLDCTLVTSARKNPTWVITTTTAIEANASHATDLSAAGVVFIAIEDTTLSPLSILHALGKEGITRVMVEAGPALSKAFLDARCVDTLYWYQAPMLLGGAGTSPIHSAELLATPAEQRTIGVDHFSRYELASCLPG